MFQRRHYEFIARTLAALEPVEGMPEGTRYQWEQSVENFATALSRDNGNFQRDRFLRACGLQP